MMDSRLTLSELQLVIRDSLYLSLPDFYWVVAEISEIKQNYSGHCYLELIEKQEDDLSIKARIKAVIWASRYNFIKSFFENSTGESLREGFKVLVKARIEYHELYGLSLVINDIDPSYTIGEMAVKRQMIIKQLEQEGVFGMNRELELPVVPQRIAIVSSRNAAGYTDFINHLTGNSFRYVFYTALFDAVMQGTETEQSIISALDRIALKSEMFDLVVIIRGGGSQTDLSWFDNYNIAFHVTQFPLPVITGIGHDKDLSVTDMVACKSLKTPTAVADFIIESVAEMENHLFEISSDIREIAQEIIETFRERVERASNTIIPLTKIMLSDSGKILTDLTLGLSKSGIDKIFKAGIITANRLSRINSSALSLIAGKANIKESLKKDLASRTSDLTRRINQMLLNLENRMDILSPDNVLKRGYTITSVNGRIIKSATEPMENDVLDTMFSDGNVQSIVKKGKQIKTE